MFKKIKLAFVAAAVMLSATFTAQAQDLTEDQVLAIVAKYIQENGGEIASSVERFQAEELRNRAAALLKPETPVLGNRDALVSVIEFSDYRCGFCRRVQDTLNRLREEYDGRVAFAFKTMPILSKESEDAALAALAANRQDKFWEYHAEIWDNQSRLGEPLFVEAAEKVGLDMERFESDRKDPSLLSQVASARQAGQSFGAEGTPFFLIGGEPLGGAQPYENFKRAIDAALEAAEKAGS